MTRYWARRAWTGATELTGVEVTTAGGAIRSVVSDVTPADDATRLTGVVIPGLVNVHSHAFHRALRGRSGGEHFWSWRDRMYGLAERLDPDSYRRLATAVYAEMLLTGITAVGEFHYLHHGPGGARYSDPNEMSHALVDAARAAGIRLTLLDTCYLTAAVDGTPLSGVQLRYGDGSVDGWADRHGALIDRHRNSDDVLVGAAVHSVRAVPRDHMRLVAEITEGPIHVHASEQPAENQDCIDRYGRTPIELLADTDVLTPSTTVVHAVHTTSQDHSVLRASGAGVCVCPTTEADLGDGFAPVAELVDAGVPVSLGSDSHAVIDLFTETRTVEYHDRARRGKRRIHPPRSLLQMATGNGATALGHPRWGLVPGAPADFVAVDDRSIRTAGAASIADLALVATAADVRDVVVGGRMVVTGGSHGGLQDPAGMLDRAILELWEERT